MSDSLHIGPQDLHRYAMQYTALHEGAAPREVIAQRVEDAPRTGTPVIAGAKWTRIKEIQYRKYVTNGTFSYHHPFKPHARPMICMGPGGRLWIMRGRYVTTYRGIEDRVKSKVQRERMPSRATHLTTLGPIEWILVEADDGREERLSFGRSEGVEIAHDQRGDLQILYPDSRGAPRESGRPTRREDMRRTRSRRHARHNPTAAVAGKQPASLGQALSTERLKAMFKTSVILGGGAFVGVMGINKLFEKVDALNGIQSEYTKAALKAAIGVVGGLVLGFAVPAAAPLAAGLAIGGVYVGVDMAVAKYRLDNPGTPAVNPPANPNPPAVNPPAPGTTPPANGVYGMAYRPANGAELPAGYTAYTAAACASR